jgi:hypothetical protein
MTRIWIQSISCNLYHCWGVKIFCKFHALVRTAKFFVVCRISVRLNAHKFSRISIVEKQKRRSSDTILFLAATASFSAYQDRANGHFYDENEKLLSENNAASQAASEHWTKGFASGNDLFSVFMLWIVAWKTSNTGAEKLSGRTHLMLDGVYPLYKLIEGNSMKSYGAAKANWNSTNNIFHLRFNLLIHKKSHSSDQVCFTARFELKRRESCPMLLTHIVSWRVWVNLHTSGYIREPETKSSVRKNSQTASFAENKVTNMMWFDNGFVLFCDA